MTGGHPRAITRKGSKPTEMTPATEFVETGNEGPQPSRRSSRQRFPSSKAEPSPPNADVQLSSINAQDEEVDRGRSGVAPSRTRGTTENANGATNPDERNVPSGPDQLDSKSKRGTCSGENTLKRSNQQGDDPEEDEDDKQMRIIAEHAEQLLRLDSQAYKENIMVDADQVLDKFLLPMNLPWCHKSTLGARTMARDIDELPAIAGLGLPSAGTSYSERNKNHGGRQISSAYVMSSCRLTTDTGVVELKKQAVPVDPLLDGDFEIIGAVPQTAGQLKVSTFHHALSIKRRRLQNTPKPEVKLVSFRFGSSSSRATILKNSSRKRPLLMTAAFAEDYQRGKRILIEKAKELARELGSYDYRYGLSNAKLTSDRIRTGRNRIIWSTKHITGNRPTYKSLLTALPLEGTTYKRPISVSVGIRLNGNLVGLERSPSKEDENVDSALSLAFTEDEIEAALTSACGVHAKVSEETLSRTVYQEQCSLDSKKLSAMLKDAHSDDTETRAPFTRACTPYQVTWDDELSNVLVIHPPVIDTIPSQDGVVRTLCSRPGCISVAKRTTTLGSPTKTSTSIDAAAFLGEMSRRSLACAVCWSSSTKTEDICVCSKCDLRVHVICHRGNHQGKGQAGPEWQCNSCMLRKKGNSNPSRPCQICPVLGGVMSKVSGIGWCHDVCHVWCDSKHGGSGEVGQCSICSGAGTRVIRCAARGCSVTFHPMCAVLYSRASQYYRTKRRVVRLPDASNSKSIPEQETLEDDICQSTQYELVSTRIGIHGQGADKDYPVYLGFCGVHNKQRLPEFYGIYPGGSYYADCTRVPPLRR